MLRFVALFATVTAQSCYDITDGKFDLSDCLCNESCATCAWSEMPDLFDCLSCFRNYDFTKSFPDGRGECIHKGSEGWSEEWDDVKDDLMSGATQMQVTMAVLASAIALLQ